MELIKIIKGVKKGCNIDTMGGRRFQCAGPSPTLGSLGTFHQWCHKFWGSLWGPPCAQVVAGTPHGEVHDTGSQIVHILSSDIGEVHNFGRLFTNPTYATSLSIQITTFVYGIALAFIIVEGNNIVFFFVAYESKCFPLDIIPIVSQNFVR